MKGSDLVSCGFALQVPSFLPALMETAFLMKIVLDERKWPRRAPVPLVEGVAGGRRDFFFGTRAKMKSQESRQKGTFLA
jgi:hypothetical protein